MLANNDDNRITDKHNDHDFGRHHKHDNNGSAAGSVRMPDDDNDHDNGRALSMLEADVLCRK